MDKITRIKIAFFLERRKIALREGDKKRAEIFWKKYQELINK